MANRVRITVVADGSPAAAAFARIRAAATNAVDGISRSFSDLSGHAKLVVAGIGAIFAGLPAALAAVGALMVPAIAAGFIGIAALAFKSDQDVRSAFKSMTSSVAGSVKEAAEPMKGALVEALGLLTSAAIQAKPALTSIFRETATLTGPLVGVFTDFVQSLLPGFTAALKGSLPVIEGMRDGMVRIGQGLSNMIASMTSNKEGLAEIWRVLGEGVGTLLETIGELTAELIESGAAAHSMELVFDVLKIGVEALGFAAKVTAGDMSAFTDALNVATDAGKRNAEQNMHTLGFSDPLKSFWDDLLGPVQRGTGAVKENTEANKGLSMSFGEVMGMSQTSAEALNTFADETLARLKAEARASAEAVAALVAQFIALNEKALTAIEAESAFEAQLAKVTEAVRKHSGSLRTKNGQLDLSNAKTRDLAAPLFDLARKTMAASEAARKNGASWNTQRGLLERGRQGLITAARQMGLTRDQARRLADSILKIPTKRHISLTSNAAQVAARIRRAADDIAGALRRATGMGRAHGGVVGGRRHGGVTGGGMAHGGIKGAQSGGIRSNLTMVGESGPELVRLPPGSHVSTNSDTRRKLGGSGAGGGGGIAQTLLLKSSGRRVDDMLIEILRESIHQRGGNPITVLGG